MGMGVKRQRRCQPELGRGTHPFFLNVFPLFSRMPCRLELSTAGHACALRESLSLLSLPCFTDCMSRFLHGPRLHAGCKPHPDC